MTLQEIARALGGEVSGNRVLAPGPGHGKRDRSLCVSLTNKHQSGFVVHSFAGQEFDECRDYVKGLLGVKDEPVRSTSNVSHDDTSEARVKHALTIWWQTEFLGELANRYFTEHRKLDLAKLPDLSHCLRWHDKERMIVGLMTDPKSGEPIGIHRTYLDPNGVKLERKMLGRAGVIRLTPDEDVTDALHIVEGVETGLRIIERGYKPTWSLTSAAGVSGFPVLAGIEHLTIFADDDPTGASAASTCARRWADAGVAVDVYRPESNHNGT